MRYQYKREPLTGDEATRLANACNPHEEKLVVWVLLDTGLRVSELANLKRANLDWQTDRLMIYGKGGPFGSKSKRRVAPHQPSDLARPPQNKLSKHSRRPTGARLQSPKNIQIPTRPQPRG